MTITSTAFVDNQPIPSEYTCDGDNVNPPLTFSEIQLSAASLALIVDDPDAPGNTFTHWIVYNMTPGTMQILENQAPQTGESGINDFGHPGYGGPCPPTGTHHYRFTVYALDSMLQFDSPPNRRALEAVMTDHIIEQATITGLYAKSA